MNRKEIHQTFVRRFNTGTNPVSSTDKEVSDYENSLGSLLPNSFIEFMKNHGPMFSSNMLDPIVENELDLWDVQNIEKLTESIEATKGYWSAGMPSEFVIFGNDSMGNAFCFKKTKVREEDSTVYFFDHDFCEMELLANSLDEWMLKYIKEIPE